MPGIAVWKNQTGIVFSSAKNFWCNRHSPGTNSLNTSHRKEIAQLFW